jgi:hypothetical protein
MLRFSVTQQNRAMLALRTTSGRDFFAHQEFDLAPGAHWAAGSVIEAGLLLLTTIMPDAYLQEPATCSLIWYDKGVKHEIWYTIGEHAGKRVA